MEPIVALSHVWRRFGDVEAVADVSFEVRPGEVFGLLGHNGAGKTTLIRVVNGLLTCDAGTALTFGMDPTSDGDRVRARTGVLTTYPALDEYLSPAENLAVYAAIHGLPADVARPRIADLLSRLGLDPRSSAPARGLSAGLKQRVALARALVHDPELLLLDEPTANLDPLAARGVRDMVRDLAHRGKTVVFSTHNLAEAEQLCDQVAILRNGRLLAVGSLGELSRGRLQSGLQVQVGVGHEEDARQALVPMLNGHPVTVRGQHIFLAGIGPDEAPAVLRHLVSSDVPIVSAVPWSPSLEDVYVAVHDKVGAP